jgi:hypothetical protein
MDRSFSVCFQWNWTTGFGIAELRLRVVSGRSRSTYGRVNPIGENQVSRQPWQERTMKENQTPRRQFLKIGAAALAMTPAIVVLAQPKSH